MTIKNCPVPQAIQGGVRSHRRTPEFRSARGVGTFPTRTLQKVQERADVANDGPEGTEANRDRILLQRERQVPG